MPAQPEPHKRQYSRNPERGANGHAKDDARAQQARIEEELRDRPFPPHDGEAPPVEPFDARPFTRDLVANLKPREWIYGDLACRKYISALGGLGGTGKTAYLTTVALAVVTGQPLLGERIHLKEGARVWFYNLEDPLDEMVRRFDAAMRFHKVSFDDLGGRLFLNSGRDRRVCILDRTKDGSTIVTPHKGLITDELVRKRIDLTMLDPFIKTHRLSENDNTQMDEAATSWAEVANDANCAVILPMHFRKGGTDLSSDAAADAFRGARALIDASRAAHCLAPMTKEDAEKLSIPEEERRFLIGKENAKRNLTPPAAERTWLKLEPVDIITGESVQAISRWSPPGPFHDVDLDLVNAILDEVAARSLVEAYTKARQGKRWLGHKIMDMAAERGDDIDGALAARMIAAWLKEGILEEREVLVKKNKRNGLFVNQTRRASPT